jgi:hypothetical protein
MAPPKEAGASMSVPKKPRGQPTTPLVVEETQRHHPQQKYSPGIISHQEIHLHQLKLVEPPIPKGVIMEGDMLGLIPALKYEDHDIINENKFLELISSKFLMHSISSKTHMIVIKPRAWDRGMQKACLLNLFDIPHFGGVRR